MIGRQKIVYLHYNLEVSISSRLIYFIEIENSQQSGFKDLVQSLSLHALRELEIVLNLNTDIHYLSGNMQLH